MRPLILGDSGSWQCVAPRTQRPLFHRGDLRESELSGVRPPLVESILRVNPNAFDIAGRKALPRKGLHATLLMPLTLVIWTLAAACLL